MLYSDQTLDGLGLFCFSLERASDGFWHTYIICEPIMVGGAPLDRVQGYRLGIAGRELLIAPWPIASAAQARALATLWAEQRYQVLRSTLPG
jgi:hypothetical protein